MVNHCMPLQLFSSVSYGLPTRSIRWIPVKPEAFHHDAFDDDYDMVLKCLG